MTNPIIRVENLSKAYRIGAKEVIPTGALGTLKQMVKSPFKYLASTLREPAPDEMIWALKDVSFEVYPGEVVGIIGRNGAGKSTLLKILSRITKPTSGFAEIRGRVASLLEVGTGFHPELTGRENVYLNGTILGMTKREVDAKFDEIVDFSGIEKFIDTPVKRYSSGMQVRLAFAVAAHLDPDILIVDEVLAVGDADFQDKCIGKMNQLSNEKSRTILFVTHQLGLAAQLCQRGILFHLGKIHKDNIISKVIEDYFRDKDKGYSYSTRNDGVIDIKKPLKFVEIFTSNEESKKTNMFSFKESIYISCLIYISSEIIKINTRNMSLGIALLNRFKNKVFTVTKPLNQYISSTLDIERNILIRLQVPSGVIAPANYSFTCALFEPKGLTLEIIEDCCSCTIYDSTGTDYSLYEGIHCGDIVIEPVWQ